MASLQTSSALHEEPISSVATGESRDELFSASATQDKERARSMWVVAASGMLVAITAANLLCISPRWYSTRFISLVYEPVKFVVLTAAIGCAAVQVMWAMLSAKPSAGPIWIARNLSAGWVFLPCFVLLYERASYGMFLAAGLVTLGTVFGLRGLIPAASRGTDITNLPGAQPSFAALPSLDGLPPRDSPLMLAFWIAVCAQAGVILAANGSPLLAAYSLSLGLFLLAWRWSASEPVAVLWWIGRHPPLRQSIVAILLTSFLLLPFTIGHRFGFYSPRHMPPPPVAPSAADHDSTGYFDIVLYPPPKKKEFVAPAPESPSTQIGRMTKPIVIPFDGPYWYFKPPHTKPSFRAHIAHGRPTDINVHSTDWSPLLMEAHQDIGQPIDLGCCGELDLAITNADIRPGEIKLSILLTDSASPGKAPLLLSGQPIVSSQFAQIPINRAPVNETLRFPIPSSRMQRRFSEITVIFMPSSQRARAGAKVSIDSFRLIPK